MNQEMVNSEKAHSHQGAEAERKIQVGRPRRASRAGDQGQ